MAYLNPVARTRLEKVAQDNGFDIPSGQFDDLLLFKSTHSPLRIWLGLNSETEFVVLISDGSVFKTLQEVKNVNIIHDPSIKDAIGGFISSSLSTVFYLVKRAYQISCALPDSPLLDYINSVKDMPKETEIERLVIQRVGQNIFREKLIEYWDSKCSVTGFNIVSLLRASHTKPWSISTDAERLNVFNGLLLSPSLDLAFDQGRITFNEIGSLILSPTFPPREAEKIGIRSDMRISAYQEEHDTFMIWHRNNVFISS